MVDVRRPLLMVRQQKGFTLIEAMVSIAVLTIFLLGVVAVQAYFGTQTMDRELRSFLLDEASNALLQFRNGIAPATSFTYRNQTGTISLSTVMLAEPNPNYCMSATATAALGAKSMAMTTSVCSF